MSKCREIFHYLHKKDYNVILLHETHSTKNCEKIWSNELGRTIYFSHGEPNACGVAILVKKM